MDQRKSHWENIYTHKSPEEVSEAVESIVYYLDNGTPEPVRSALLEGGKWWNQAFRESLMVFSRSSTADKIGFHAYLARRNKRPTNKSVCQKNKPNENSSNNFSISF